MNAEAIREMLRRQPFLPLEVQLSSGETYTIVHPEFAIVLKTRMILGFPDPRLSDSGIGCFGFLHRITCKSPVQVEQSSSPLRVCEFSTNPAAPM